jgi:hypothetical protein
MNPLFGMRVVTNHFLVETVPHPRSPGRAARRAKRGHRQHYITRPMSKAFSLPDGTLAMHPLVWEQMQRVIGR